MKNRTLKEIREILRKRGETDERKIDDLLREIQWVVNDTLDGETMYATPADVIQDYLNLTGDYAKPFILAYYGQYENDEEEQ